MLKVQSQNHFEFLKHALIVKVFTHLLVVPHNFYKGTATEWKRGNNAAAHGNRKEWKELCLKSHLMQPGKQEHEM